MEYWGLVINYQDGDFKRRGFLGIINIMHL